MVILSLVLIIEGLYVMFLFSYVGFFFGALSLLAGSSLYATLRETMDEETQEIRTPGVRLVDFLFRMIGGEYSMMILGASCILAVILFNKVASSRPEFGDIDTLSMAFGATILFYPLVRNRFKTEATFALVFIGSVILLLVLPLIVTSLAGGGAPSGAGSWYVHYMLAAPFSGILSLIGIPSGVVGNLVTIQFQDGSIHTLSISAYCAGLYSLSIFLSAFIAFVLVFEKLPKRALAIVLALGLLVAYLGNLLRMVIIGVIGFYEGIEALHWAHENAGWLIFLSWSSVFWWFLLIYASKHDTQNL